MLKFSLRYKLLIIFVVVFTIPLMSSIVLTKSYTTDFSKENMRTLSINNMQNIGARTDQFFKTVYDFSIYIVFEKNIRKYLTASPDDPDKNIIRLNAQESLSLLPFSNEYIKSVSVYNNVGDYISSGSEKMTITDFEKKEMDKLNGYQFWYFEKIDDKNSRIFFCRKMRDPYDLKTGLGYLKIELNTQSLKKIFTSTNGMDNVYYNVVDQNNRLIVSSAGDKGKTKPIIAQNILEEYEGSTFSEKGIYTTPYYIPSVKWYVYSVAEDNYIKNVEATLAKMLLIFAILCFVFCFLLSLFFSKIITTPLKKLGKLMTSVSNEDFTVRFNPKKYDEITVLANQFDAMSRKLNILYNQVYLSNLKLKEAELAELQAKINPHFLYNTLDTIYWMSEMNKTKDVSNMVSALSNLFKLSLSGDENNMIDLYTEIKHIECYLYIQQIRHGGNLKYTIDVNLDCEERNIRVIKLVLQPIVENGIIHGIDIMGSGELYIKIYSENDILIYKIVDTAGCGDMEKINKIIDGENEKKAGIGLRNINERIKLKYGSEYGLSFELVENKSVFTVKQPIILKSNEE